MTCTKQYLKWLLMYFEEITKANYFSDFSGRSDGKESACNMGDRVQSLGGEDSLEKGMATHSSILAWRIPWTEEPGGLPWSLKSQTRQSD